jgi:hypothetical protein
VYDREGFGVLTRDEVRDFFLASLHGEADDRNHSSPPEASRPSTAGASGHAAATGPAGASTGGRRPPQLVDAAQEARTVQGLCDSVYDALDVDKSGTVSRAAVLAHVVAHPELPDVAAVFGRAMLPGEATELETLLATARAEAVAARAAADRARARAGGRGNTPGGLNSIMRVQRHRVRTEADRAAFYVHLAAGRSGAGAAVAAAAPAWPVE